MIHGVHHIWWKVWMPSTRKVHQCTSPSTFAQFLLSSRVQLLFLRILPFLMAKSHNRPHHHIAGCTKSCPSLALHRTLKSRPTVWLKIYPFRWFSFNKVPNPEDPNHILSITLNPNSNPKLWGRFRVQKSPRFSWLSPKIPTALPKGFIFGPDPSRFSLFRSFLYHNACHRTPQSGDSLGYHQHKTGHMECQWGWIGSPKNTFFFKYNRSWDYHLAIIDLERMWNMEVTHLSTKQRPFYFGLKQSMFLICWNQRDPTSAWFKLKNITYEHIWSYLIFHHLFPILLPSLVLSYFLQFFWSPQFQSSALDSKYSK